MIQPLFSAKFNQPPKKPKNLDVRTREYLAIEEIEALRKAARQTGRQGLRDDTILLMMFRHALRVSELTALKWEQIDFKNGLLHVQRLKNGIPATHPLQGPTIRALRKIKQQTQLPIPYIFVTERGTSLAPRTVHDIIARAGQLAKLPFSIHPHMLRHSTGFYLANKGLDTRAIQAYMGHSSINNTVRYTALSAQRFKGFWND